MIENADTELVFARGKPPPTTSKWIDKNSSDTYSKDPPNSSQKPKPATDWNKTNKENQK